MAQSADSPGKSSLSSNGLTTTRRMPATRARSRISSAPPVPGTPGTPAAPDGAVEVGEDLPEHTAVTWPALYGESHEVEHQREVRLERVRQDRERLIWREKALPGLRGEESLPGDVCDFAGGSKEQLLFRREVPVEGPFCDLGRLADVVDADFGVSTPREGVNPGLEQSGSRRRLGTRARPCLHKLLPHLGAKRAVRRQLEQFRQDLADGRKPEFAALLQQVHQPQRLDVPLVVEMTVRGDAVTGRHETGRDVVPDRRRRDSRAGHHLRHGERRANRRSHHLGQ